MHHKLPGRRFTYNGHELGVNRYGHINLQHTAAKRDASLDEHDLVYNKSFVDNADSGVNIYYKYDKPSILKEA